MPKPIQVFGERLYYFPQDTEWKLRSCQEDDENILVPLPRAKPVSDILNEVQLKENNGRGVRCVQSMIAYLREGDFQSAQIVRQLEGDKTRSYPLLEVSLNEIFGCRLHGNYGCEPCGLKLTEEENNLPDKISVIKAYQQRIGCGIVYAQMMVDVFWNQNS